MPALLLNHVTLLDGTGADPREHLSLLAEDGRITRIAAAGTIAPPDDCRSIDAGGRMLMPGLTDAHVHFGLTAASQNDEPESHVSYVMNAAENIRLALDEGFTTVRDAGGLDPAFAQAVADGQIRGPRILPAGSFISQTGGHGDARSRWDDAPRPSIPGLRAHSEICDSPDAVRRAARMQIRRGATQVKLMASGGVMSPNDPIVSLQFTVEEMAAAVQVARSFGTYVMAHCHTSGAIENALAAGVRSIEHGSITEERIAQKMVKQDAFLVPTLAIIEILARASGIPEFSRQKLDFVHGEMRRSVEVARTAGVRIGSGSDLLGPRQHRRASELAEKAKEMGAMAAIVSATQTNAALFRMERDIGSLEAGKAADLILVDGDPLADISILSDASRLPLVVLAGDVVKDRL
jgi:imidazolonepropionase-like amidohydrolase